MYAAFGVASPFLPAFLSARGLVPEQLGFVLGAGTAVRLLSAPLAGRIGDLTHALRVVLVVCIALATSVTLGYLVGQGFWIFLGVSLLHAASLAPITVLADALALGSASPPPSSGRRGFEYGWVRGTGSAAFIIGTLLSGQAVSVFGLDFIVWLQAFLLGVAALAATLVPELIHPHTADAVRAPAGGVLILVRLPLFRSLVLVTALILGSHSMHDAFTVIRWSASGISPSTASFLWSESVAAEVLVFFHWSTAGDAADAGRRARYCHPSWHVALGSDGADNRCDGACAGAATARYHFCAASSCLHASDHPHRAAWARRDGAGDLRYCRYRSGHRVAHPCLRRALCASRVPRVLGHGWAVRVCLPVDLEAEVIDVRGRAGSIDD